MRQPKAITNFEDTLSTEDKAELSRLCADRSSQEAIDKTNNFLRAHGAPEGKRQVAFGEGMGE